MTLDGDEVKVSGMQIQATEQVRISALLSCGCRTSKSAPLRMTDANVWPGSAVICDSHDEHAVVIRVSTYLHDPRGAIERALRHSGLDTDDAAAIAAEQTAER